MTRHPWHILKKKLLAELFNSFRTGIRAKKSEKPRQWLKEKSLHHMDVDIGFNSGQFHHRKDEAFKQEYERIGVLKRSDAAVKSPELTAYTCFGAYAIMFPLKDSQGDIVNLYAIRIGKKTEKKEYLNKEGIYPGYPHLLTTRLFITSNILDAASLLQSKVMENRDAVMALFDGELREQHLEAIKQLKHLQQIIFI